MEFIRARKDGQIEERKEEILTIASDLCGEYGVMGWSLNELGRRCSITKSNLYRYFGSREEVLMQLLALEMKAFVTGLDRVVGDETFEIESFSRIIAGQYAKRPFFCELLSVGPSILEHNVNIDSILPVKRSMLSLIQPHTATFQKALKWITEDKAVWASQTIALYVAGLWPIANPSKTIQELSKRPEFESIKINFETELTAFANTILLGCKNRTIK